MLSTTQLAFATNVVGCRKLAHVFERLVADAPAHPGKLFLRGAGGVGSRYVARRPGQQRSAWQGDDEGQQTTAKGKATRPWEHLRLERWWGMAHDLLQESTLGKRSRINRQPRAGDLRNPLILWPSSFLSIAPSVVAPCPGAAGGPVSPVALVLPVAPVSPPPPVSPVAPVLPVAPVYPVAPCGPARPAGSVKQALKASVVSVGAISFEWFR